jgi:transketolase
MRTEFLKFLKEEMKIDEAVFFLVADQGLGLIEPFQNEFPNRVLNVGISEQNLIGVASGLVNIGFRPFCYTISNFLIQRCFEQIRDDICLHKYPITLIGNSTGFDNGLLGPTHHVIDDMGCLKVLPEINIYSPSSIGAIKPIFNEILKNRKPAYIRIGKSSYLIDSQNEVNQMIVENNSKVLVVTHGTMLEACVKGSLLKNKYSVYCMNRIKPLEKEKLSELFLKYKTVVVVEDHFVSSGLYNSLCQFAIEINLKARLLSIGTPEIYEEVVGNKEFFAERYGFTPEKINEYIAKLL